ncbi:MAG TPA: type II toxin-antitoxin system VapC family toxin [Bryobacteraceae bacterium]|nr:type II toxin-antitoxin system VapC family toxin [Bryobacteraceae bacterium]
MNEDLLLLDTHIWLWAQLGLVDNISRAALAAIRRAESAGRLRVSIISLWELGMLTQCGRISLPQDVRTWVRDALTKPGISLAPLTPEIALESSHLPGILHGDPADRILAATARNLRATLLTKDQQLLEYSRQHHLRALSA